VGGEGRETLFGEDREIRKEIKGELTVRYPINILIHPKLTPQIGKGYEPKFMKANLEITGMLLYWPVTVFGGD
jgi:hypothetical protein